MGGTTGRPIGYGLVLLVDTAGRERARSVTDAAGHFVLEAPEAGLYRLRALRIGYRGWASPLLQLLPGEPLRYRATLPEIPVELGAIAVEVEGRCRVRPGEGQPAAALWEEAQKALSVTELAVEGRLFRFRSVTFERSLAPDLSVTEERSDTSVGFSAWPFESLAPESLARAGFVQEAPGGPTYYGPDSRRLLFRCLP